LQIITIMAMFEHMSGTRILLKFKTAIKMEGVSPMVRRVLVAATGGTVLLIGIALIVLPRPAFVVIPVGLAILATEFAWAKKYLDKARGMVKTIRTPR
jgi:hypothetical protein